MLLAQLWAGFQSFPLLPRSKLGPSGADSWVGGFVYVLGPCGLSNELSCGAGSFSCHLNSHRFFKSEILRLYFTSLEPWVVRSILLPSCSSCLSTHKFGTAHSASSHFTQSSSRHLPMSPLRPNFLPPPFLSVCMDVSSLTPWLSDFHTVEFSVSSGCFWF